MEAIGDLACQLHRLRPAHRTEHQRHVLLHRPRRSADARIPEEVALKVDRALVEQRADHAMGFAQPADRAAAVPLDPVLLEHGEIAQTQDDLRAAAAQLVKRGGKLSDMGRITQIHRRDTRTETDPLGPTRHRPEEQPGVLVIDLIRPIARVEAKLVCRLRCSNELLGGLLRDQLQAHLHPSASLTRPARTRVGSATPHRATRRCFRPTGPARAQAGAHPPLAQDRRASARPSLSLPGACVGRARAR